MGDDNLLERVLASSPAKFAFITENAEHFRFQALLSHFTLASSTGRPTLSRHGYRVDQQYFYPASAIKLCGIVAALYKLEHLQKSLGLDVSITTPLAFYPLQEGDQFLEHDPSNIIDGMFTLANEIRKCLLISEDAAFNNLYAFTGQRYLNEKMWQLGLLSTRIHQRLALVMSTEVNRFCQPVEVHAPGMRVTLPPKKNVEQIHDVKHFKGLKVGKGHALENGEVVMQPMDFTKKNYISLLDLQNLLIKIFCPDAELNSEPCKLFHASRMFLQETMAEYPSESCNPVYSKSEFPDDYCKFFLPGICRVRPKRAVRIFNKVGRAYGFTTDNSYIFDKERGQGFFLSAVIYTNSNGILNDDKYEYEAIADRVMADLGEMVARAVWKIPPKESASDGGEVEVGTSSLNVGSSSLEELRSLRDSTNASVGGNISDVEVPTSVVDVPYGPLKELKSPQQRANASDGGEISEGEVQTGFLDVPVHASVQHIPEPSNVDSLHHEGLRYVDGQQVDAYTQECESAAFAGEAPCMCGWGQHATNHTSVCSAFSAEVHDVERYHTKTSPSEGDGGTAFCTC